MLLVLITGLFMIGEFFFNVSEVTAVAEQFRVLAVTVAAVAMCVAAVSVTVNGVHNISKRTKGQWPYYAWSVIFLWFWIIFGLYSGPTSENYLWLFNNILAALYASILGVLIFSLAIGFYRSMALRGTETGILIVAAVLVMLGSVTIGALMWGGFQPLSTWILSVPGGGAYSALIIITAIGVMSISFRTIIGMDLSWMGILRSITGAKKEEKPLA
jgi:hypothetical protein